MEYLVLYRRGLTYEYGLLWDGDDNGLAHLCGLLNVGDVNRSGSDAEQSAPGRGVVGSQSESEKVASGQMIQGLEGEAVGVDENAVIKGKRKRATAIAPDVNQEVQHG